jgi:hypothetical protein
MGAINSHPSHGGGGGGGGLGGGGGGGASYPAPFHAIGDSFADLPSLQAALRRAGLESSNLIVAVDFTKSNEWTGKHSFAGRCLHAISHPPPGAPPGTPPPWANFYETAISVIGRTLSPFDDDGLIPAFGFGCAATHDNAVFAFQPGGAPCRGFGEVLAR